MNTCGTFQKYTPGEGVFLLTSILIYKIYKYICYKNIFEFIIIIITTLTLTLDVQVACCYIACYTMLYVASLRCYSAIIAI